MARSLRICLLNSIFFLSTNVLELVAFLSFLFFYHPTFQKRQLLISRCRLPVEQRRGYKNAFDALVRITKEEGVTTLWRGWRPTVMRAMVLNAAQLGE
jgi:hypothetical protein